MKKPTKTRLTQKRKYNALVQIARRTIDDLLDGMMDNSDDDELLRIYKSDIYDAIELIADFANHRGDYEWAQRGMSMTIDGFDTYVREMYYAAADDLGFNVEKTFDY